MSDPTVHAAGLYGLDNSIWHQEGINVISSEISAIASGLTDTSRFQSAGIIVAGVKYLYLNKVDNNVVGRHGATTILLSKTRKAIVVAILKDGQTGIAKQFSFICQDLISKTF